MPIDPRLFLSIPGPTQPVQLQPGFRPPGQAAAPPLMPPQGMGMGIPNLAGLAGMAGKGMRPSTSGMEMPASENDGLAGAVAGIGALKPNADGTWAQPRMPTDIGSGGGGSFMSWLRGLF